MHRNTLLLIVFLGIFAALVVGVNLGRINAPVSQAPTPTPTPLTPTATPVPKMTFTDDTCGIQLSYPPRYTKVQLETGGTTFLNPLSPIDVTTLDCQNYLPRLIPKGATSSTLMIGTMSGTLYTPPPPATGSAQEKKKLYVRNTNKKKDIVISGSGDTFDNLVGSLSLY